MGVFGSYVHPWNQSTEDLEPIKLIKRIVRTIELQRAYVD